MAFYHNIRTAILKRAQYERTRREIAALPLDVALDLDIDKTAASKIAYQSVYGQ